MATGMLDKSLKELGKAVRTQKSAQAFIRKDVLITEKFDGTKLTLVRNGRDFDPDSYENNWIIAYKGNVLYKSEFESLMDDPEMHERIVGKSEARHKSVHEGGEEGGSIGMSQYALIHEHMRSIQSSLGDIPKNTEFFVEFMQNKMTTSQKYGKYHDMFLVGFGQCAFRVSKGMLYTSSKFSTDMEAQSRYASILKIGTFPVIFDNSNFSSDEAIERGFMNADRDPEIFFSHHPRGTLDYDDAMSIVTAIAETFSSIESTLGGSAEGVVISAGDVQYKVLNPTQLDPAYRAARKNVYKMPALEEEAYWRAVTRLARMLVADVDKTAPIESSLGELSKTIYSLDEIDYYTGLKGGEKLGFDPTELRRNFISRLDDLYLTVRLLMLREVRIAGAKKIGLFPMAAKPFHDGHWKAIKLASNELGSDGKLFVLISTADRSNKSSNISHETMFKIWNEFIIDKMLDALHNVDVSFATESPMQDAIRIVSSERDRGAVFIMFGDPVDAPARAEQLKEKFPDLASAGLIEAFPIKRTDTKNISGTQMRAALDRGDYETFKKNLPSMLSNAEKDEMLKLLLNDTRAISEILNSYIKCLLMN